jgi:hypothetical protein
VREHENFVGWFHGQKPVNLDEDTRLVGGAGIFQLFEPKEKFKRRKINRKIAAWRIKSIRRAKNI